jgi:hypothetical protein
MAISNGFWPLSLSVESLVLREMVPNVVYEVARGQSMRKKQVSREKKSVGRGSNAAHFTYNMRHVHHMHRTTACLAPIHAPPSCTGG